MKVNHPNDVPADRECCPICGGAEVDQIQGGVRHDPDRAVLMCRSCGTGFLHPFPTDEELDAYYSEGEVYHAEDGDPPVRERYECEKGEARRRADSLRPFLRWDASLLEVGCGSGAFMAAVKDSVHSVLGVEPNEESRKWISGGLGLSAVADIDLLLKEGKRFHVVALFHVLEHIRDPIAFVSRLVRLVQPGGKLIVEVPNVRDALLALYDMEAFARFYFCKPHLLYFAASSLELVLKRSGCSKVEIRGIQRYDLSNHLRWLRTGRPGGQGFYSCFPESLNRAYADALISAQYSDTLLAIGSL